MFSIRVKILALILSALLLSLVSYLAIGRSLILSDKSSYIYDYNLSIVREVEMDISAQIDRLQTISQSLALVLWAAPKNPELVRSFYKQNQAILPADGLLVVRVQSPNEFGSLISFPTEKSPLQAIFSSEKWRPVDFEHEAVLVGSPINGRIPLGFRAVDNSGQPVILFSLLEIRQSQFQEYIKKMRIEILISGRELAHFGFELPTEKLNTTSEKELRKFRAEIFSSPFATGTQEIQLRGTEFLGSYAKIQNAPLMVVGMISKEASFETAAQLVRQSLLLGLGILFLAISCALLFSKGITSRLKQLWMATQKVSAGDFETHIPIGRARDEITDLSVSFNTMSDRIHELLKETAVKARMEAELETAQTVQSRFFPSSDFDDKNLRIAGMAIPATECAGDWWQYRKIGPFLILAIGDVTGHGVSSALVTAAAHGTFSVLLRRCEAEFSSSGRRPDPGEIMRELNEAVCATGGGSVSMTMLLQIIDTRTGEMLTCNASHRPAYLYRPRSTDVGEVTNGIQAFQVVQGSKIQQLGMTKEFSVDTFSFELQPGDLIIWYTDGLVECKNPEGAPIRKADLLRLIARLRESQRNETIEDAARSVCQGLVDEFKKFLGTNIGHPDDDTTIVVGMISENAHFLRKAA